MSTRRRGGLIALIAIGLILFALLLLWTQRKPITRDIVDRELSKRGVPARYEISQLGFTTQRLENLSIGDPANPDLTARSAELRLAYTASGVRVSSVIAEGVRLRGRLVNGAVSLGALDTLMPAPSGVPFTLPDMVVDLRDARVRLDTPYGDLGFAIEGRGNLSDGFQGQVAAIARGLAVGGCTMARPTAFLNVAISDRRPSLDGPVRAESLRCGGDIAMLRPQAALDVALGEALDRWDGDARLTSAGARAGGGLVNSIAGHVSFAGTAKATAGKFDLAANGLRHPSIAARRLLAEGRYATGPAYPRLSLRADTRLVGATLPPATLRPVVRAAASTSGTPVGPLGEALAKAIARAGADADVEADFALVQGADSGALRIHRADLIARSGARASLSGGSGVTYYWPLGAARVDGSFRMGGGGLPELQGRLRQARAASTMSGELRLEPWEAGGARLDLTPVRFTSGGGATRFATTVALDGPIGDGKVEGLRLPVTGRIGAFGAFAINPDCAPLSFDRLRIAGFDFRRSQVALCPTGGALVMRRQGGGVQGGARIAQPRLAGRIGDSPVTVAARTIGFDVGRPGFSGEAVAVRMGEGDAVTRLDMARLDGDFVSGGIDGRFAGTSGKIANVPLLLSDGAGRWQLKDGILSLAGAVGVADEAAEARFQPFVSRDFTLRLADSQISAGGSLRTPAGGTHVADVRITHALPTGRGRAILDVPGIAFTDDLQPEDLTRLTLGVVANVAGSVRGQGEIRWTPDGVTSDGAFRTDGLDFAAAFGPVKGLKGEIRFDDLLGLTTPAGQQVSVAEINPGIAVSDGIIRYRLLPGQKMALEEGRWPFSGGQLILEPTVLDFGQPSTRYLTFRIEGMDAALFIEQFEFKNIAATGTFDGTMPMIFDANGGRIVGGRLVVRKGGGTLAYVGEVSNADLGVFGKMAFDALKSIRYDNLAIELDGALDGEIVSRVVFNGINESPLDGSAPEGMLKELTGLPFKFNITIKAPFRGLINSAQSLTDPRGLISQSIDRPVELPGSAPPVQPK